jgi:hypothetical protein
MEPAAKPDWNDQIGGKSRRRSIARQALHGQSQWQIVPNIQKSGKLVRHSNMRHFWMKTACYGWRSSSAQ